MLRKVGWVFLVVSQGALGAVAGLPGSVDLTFVPPSMNGELTAVAIQLDGKVLIGGEFSLIGSAPRKAIARLNPDGTLDDTFRTANVISSFPAGPGLRAIAPQSNGKVIRVHGAEGGNYALESSFDLKRWSVLTNFTGRGTIPLLDAESLDLPQRFYRVKLSP